ncbi:oviduct-specific glycoprotein-like [Biomphalaria glabrata]|uniref:Oviduct-specific glycoprotein-like n=1 Tax=Biomphalaria glabrata TaxID=6526 RepID=A0A9W3AR52_BIOGL|nr:oviduct-specific glycoprotein-like [Biomphalaria glabrata]
MKRSLLLFLLLSLVQQSLGQCQMFMCHLHAWSTKASKVTTSDIDVNLCHYIIISFAEYINDEFFQHQRVRDTYSWMSTAKRQNSRLKFVLNFFSYVGEEKFYEMYKTPTKRSSLIQSIIQSLRNNGFDGLALQLAAGIGTTEPEDYDRKLYADFLEAIRNAVDEEAKKTGKPGLMLFMYFSQTPRNLAKYFDVPRVYRYMDFVIIHGFLYYEIYVGPSKGIDIVQGHTNRIYSLDPEDDRSLDYDVKKILKLGGIKSKTIIGYNIMAAYYVVFSSSSTLYRGYKIDDYSTVCEAISKGGTVQRIPEGAPYHIDGDYLIYYDDETSVLEKVKYVKRNGFVGVYISDLSADDYKKGNCGKGKFPLIRTMYEFCSKP